MQEVLALIEKRKQEFAQLPLFKYMQDKSIHPRQRLNFYPCIVPLAMDFGYLCEYVLREEPTNDEVQEIINRHTYDEYDHWKWLLEDLEKLGFDYLQSYSKTVRDIWKKETKKSRQVCRIIERHTFNADSIYKLVAIEVAEATANVFFNNSKSVALELQKITKKEYQYFGGCHNIKEDNHEINTPDVVIFFKDIELTEEKIKNACELADIVFKAYEEAMNEFLEYAINNEIPQLVKAS